MHSVDRTHDTSLLPFHVKDLATFGQTLTEAAAAAYPTTGTSVRYKAVHVLLLSWVDDDLGVLEEISELDGAFTSIYGYATEQWKIPSTRSHNSLAKQLTGFLERYESEENLLIVYYGGHGRMNDNRQCVWSCTGADDSPTVQWSALQTMFEQAASDVVLLLDCCAAASSTGEAGGSLTELIAACGFENVAPGVGEHSFTRSLIEELRGWNHHFTMSVAKLHSEVLARIKHWKPRYASDGNCERRNTPVYVLLANEGKPRSIELTPLKRCEISKSDALSSGPLYTPPDSDEDVEMSEVPDGNITPSSHLSDSLTAVCPEDRYPKVIISVALEEDQVLHTRDWCEWLKSVPAIVKFARVQGIYKSDSTLVIMTIPVVIWDLIPADPAIAFLGFVKSENLLNSSEFPGSKMKRSLDKSMLLLTEGVAQETVTSLGNSALEGVDTTETQLGSPKATTKIRRQQRVYSTLATQTVYQPLHADNMIRLVVLEPASDYYATIHCSLMAVSLDDEPLYEAMSYVWGDGSCTSPILLDGSVFQVTLNLERALRHLRHSRRETLVLWIDAICIDQQNIEERNSQIMLMGSIYRRARGVLVWLGEETTTSSRAVGFLKRLNDEFTLLELGDHLSSLESKRRWCTICELEPSSSWRSLRKLFLRPWWTSLWSIQEAALARELTMQCGYLQFDFALVARPAALLLMLWKDYEQGESAIQYKFPDNIKQTIKIWLRAMRNLIVLKVRLSSSFGISLMAALRHYFSHKIIDPRDEILALEGLVLQQTTLKPILPNYVFRTDLVHLQAARYILDVEQNLDSVSWKSYERLKAIYDLPSWAPGWTKIRAPSLTRPRWPRAVKLIASWNEDSALEVGRHETVPSKRTSVQGRVLKVRGIQVDTLQNIGRIYPFPKVTFSHFSKLSQEAQRKMYRAQPRMQDIAEWEAFLNHSCEQHVNMTPLADSTHGIGTSSTTLSRSPKMPFKSQDTCTHLDFKYMSITSRGYVCFIPPGSQVGDVVCVLVSAKTPFILRRTDDGTHFRFVGECYVHGLMDEKVVHDPLISNYEEEEILIV